MRKNLVTISQLEHFRDCVGEFRILDLRDRKVISTQDLDIKKISNVMNSILVLEGHQSVYDSSFLQKIINLNYSNKDKLLGLQEYIEVLLVLEELNLVLTMISLTATRIFDTYSPYMNTTNVTIIQEIILDMTNITNEFTDSVFNMLFRKYHLKLNNYLKFRSDDSIWRIELERIIDELEGSSSTNSN